MCVLQMCRWCLPDDIEAQVEARLMQPGELLSPRDTQILVESAEPPLVNPVFVFTDIQQSSALWGVGDGLIMQRATEIHDNILRSALMKYRGYEITTAGDAFQLAFHTVREAVEYCMDVQLQLLEAPWPKELHNLLPATKKQRAGRHLIFCGLRVRMGIHDAVDADGTLVLDVHAVTGKMTYTGASEVIANEIGDLGDGGQILVTRRVADWLEMYADLVAIPCSVDRIGNYTVPQINTTVEVFQVIPTVLAKRKKNFTTTVATTLKRRPGHGNPGTGANSFTRNDGTPPGMSSVAAERRRNLYALRERRRQLEQGALGRPASHQALMRSESSRPSFAFDTRPSYAHVNVAMFAHMSETCLRALAQNSSKACTDTVRAIRCVEAAWPKRESLIGTSITGICTANFAGRCVWSAEPAVSNGEPKAQNEANTFLSFFTLQQAAAVWPAATQRRPEHFHLRPLLCNGVDGAGHRHHGRVLRGHGRDELQPAPVVGPAGVERALALLHLLPLLLRLLPQPRRLHGRRGREPAELHVGGRRAAAGQPLQQARRLLRAALQNQVVPLEGLGRHRCLRGHGDRAGRGEEGLHGLHAEVSAGRVLDAVPELPVHGVQHREAQVRRQEVRKRAGPIRHVPDLPAAFEDHVRRL
ncbi:hypothetical protein ON010_g12661 [Phytophthora cinnamomi]|nr:hypothetical protein ON010_g12661 [Phytophthora cinnamomi]